MDGPAVERWPRLIAQHRERQVVLAAEATPRPLSGSRRETLAVVGAVAGAFAAWMAIAAIGRIDLSPPVGALADSIGNAWGAMYAGVMLLLLAVTDGSVIALDRSISGRWRALSWAAAAALTTLVVVVVVLLVMTVQRLTYV